MLTIYGVHPVMEALECGDNTIEKIFISKGRKGKDIQKIVRVASRQEVTVLFESREYVDELTQCKNHQGVACILREFHYAAIEDILATPDEPDEASLILVLDCIEDPQNLGSIIRTGYCFGVKAIIIPEDRSASVTPSVIKASAGAALHLPIVRVVNISTVIDCFQKNGFWIYGADTAGDNPLGSLCYEGKVALVMGSEKRGIRPLIKKKCDFLVSIPMVGRLDSLNVSVATGIIVHAITQRKVKT